MDHIDVMHPGYLFDLFGLHDFGKGYWKQHEIGKNDEKKFKVFRYKNNDQNPDNLYHQDVNIEPIPDPVWLGTALDNLGGYLNRMQSTSSPDNKFTIPTASTDKIITDKTKIWRMKLRHLLRRGK